MMLFLLCILSQVILDVQFQVKTIENSGASTSGVDIFRGVRGGGLFPNALQSWGGCFVQTLDVSVPVMMGNQHHGAGLLLTAVCGDGNPLLRGKEPLFFCSPPLSTSCSSCYLSCVYMWKTGRQTAASISFGLDFPLFHLTWRELTSCQHTSGHKQRVCVPLTMTFKHEGTVRQSVTCPLTEKQFWSLNAVSSEVCVCSTTQCVSLMHQSLDEWLYWLLKKIVVFINTKKRWEISLKVALEPCHGGSI